MTAAPHTAAPIDALTPRSARLKAATAEDHNHAESQIFVQRLLGGELTIADYAAMISSHLDVYRVLEASVAAMRPHPWCTELFDKKLDRTQRLVADLADLHQTYDLDIPVSGPATSRYINRIRAVSDDPVLMIGHHYIRYLGDLSGGQAIAAMVRRHTTDVGLSFYDFADVHPIPHFKKRYRQVFDSLPLSEDDFQALVAEVQLAFRLNADIFGDLLAQSPATASRP